MVKKLLRGYMGWLPGEIRQYLKWTVAVVVVAGFVYVAQLVVRWALDLELTPCILVFAAWVVTAALLGLWVVRLKQNRLFDGKSGNFWWFCMDLQGAINMAQNTESPGRELEHQLMRCTHHAKALEIIEAPQVNGLAALWDTYAADYAGSTWTTQDTLVHRLKTIARRVGHLAESKQPDFDPGPEL